MDDLAGALAWVFLGIAIVIAIVFVIGIVLSVFAFCGTAWGSGTALVNYGRSFNKNVIESNLVSVGV